MFGAYRLLSLSVLLALAWQLGSWHTTCAEVVSYPQINQTARGIWRYDENRVLQLYADGLEWDINGDLGPDVALRHEYVYAVRPVPDQAVPYVEEAIRGLDEVQLRLTELHAYATDSFNTPYDDLDRYARNQSEVDQLLNEIYDIASYAQYNDVFLLNGSSGRTAFTNTSDLTIRQVTPNARPGVYPVDVIEPARRATVEAIMPQTQPLASDEYLTVNDVTISVQRGLTQTQTVNRLNEYAPQTSAIADVNPRTAATRLYSLYGGSGLDLWVTSNVPAASNSTGFGTAALSNNGRDAIVSIGGSQVQGAGARVFVDSGEANGVLFDIAYSTGEFAPESLSGPIGEITVVDNSLSFEYPSGDLARISFPNVLTSQLGTTQLWGELGPLCTVRVDTASRANDAVGIIGFASDEVTAERERLENLRFGVPVSANQITAIDGLRFAWSDSGSPWLMAGESIGPDRVFLADSFSLEPNTEGYLGVELTVANHQYYGWLRVSTDRDRGLVLQSAAWESTPGQPIVTAAVPEPLLAIRTWWAIALGVAALCRSNGRGH